MPIPTHLQFIDVSYKIKYVPRQKKSGTMSQILRMDCSMVGVQEERTIIEGITGMVSPGEVLAILGPSGSGKSTLLNIISGRLQSRHGGVVLANGKRLTRTEIKRIGFVAQDDVLYPHLTVRETLVFAAMLRLPRTMGKEEKVMAAEKVMVELGLEKCSETIVGNAYVRGVSGGERRRVSIGKEVLVDPSVMVLDEPTSGLDATAAQRVVEGLGREAKEKGRGVVMAVHQPASQAYQMFDLVMVMSAEGRCVYFGKGFEAMDYFGKLGFVPGFQLNPADFMLDLANGIAHGDNHGDPSSVKQTLVTSYNKTLAPKVKECINATLTRDAVQTETISSNNNKKEEEMQTKKKKKDYCNISWLSQFTILLHRSLKERRHESFSSLRIFQVLATAILAGLMWWHSNINNIQDRLGLLFFISIFLGVFASFNSVFTFPQDRPIFIKERSSGMYSLSSYFMARMVGDLPMELLLPTVFVLVVYWMAGLRPEFGAFMLTLALLLGYVLVAQGLGLALGAIIMDAKQASTMATVTMLAFLLTGGFYVQNLPAGMVWLKYASFTFYCFRLLIGVQYKQSEITRLGLGQGQGRKNDSSDIVGEIEEVGVIASVVALVVMFVGYRILAYVALRRIKI
ncbi:Taurine-transporting ATPase protein [Dioscorea alata]|uniref:Taurine-transporting ATPase protein n=1 Tax=Dioscorea alata TaxID=55571 RepID=A0ACB7W084_DIOAL|nr:Taurine-transporting ATPase protein [Dioscorea alata]